MEKELGQPVTVVNRTGGSGVGLSFARQVVLAHGGSIAADEGEDGGAVIRIAL